MPKIENKGIDLYVIADYGTGDPAFTEVNATLRSESRQYDRILSSIDNLSVPPFSTISTGFWIRQIGIEDGYEGAAIFSNTAPRGNKDDLVTWEGDEKQRLLYGRLDNGVEVFAVSAGYNWSFVADRLVAFHDLEIPNGGSQFRSRDIYAHAVVRFLAGDRSILGRALDPLQLPAVPKDCIVLDGYGNLKITTKAEDLPDEFRDSEFIVAAIGRERLYVHNHLAGNLWPVGIIGLLEGSSGERQNRWLELVLRGDSAYEKFGCPKISDDEGRVKLELAA